MDTRKVQLSGGTTYTISLPKSWAQEHGIDTDSEVTLHPNGNGSLLVDVAGAGTRGDRTTVVDISTTDVNALTEQIKALYIIGLDTITFRNRAGLSTDQHRAVRETIGDLSGFELLEVGDSRIEVQNLIDGENVDIRKSAIRLRLVMLSMHSDAITAIVTDDTDLARDVIRRDNEADKLFAMVTRYFRRSLSDLHEVKKLGNSREELFEYYYVCRQFERVADHAEKMAAFVLEEGVTVSEELTDRLERFGDQARSILDDAAAVVLTDAAVEMAHDALTRRDSLRYDIDTINRELYEHSEPDTAYSTGLLLDSIERTANYGANVAEIGIQQVLREDVGSR